MSKYWYEEEWVRGHPPEQLQIPPSPCKWSPSSSGFILWHELFHHWTRTINRRDSPQASAYLCKVQLKLLPLPVGAFSGDCTNLKALQCFEKIFILCLYWGGEVMVFPAFVWLFVAWLKKLRMDWYAFFKEWSEMGQGAIR